MKIKEVATLTGLPESTIRFYEEEGLFAPDKEYINGRYYRSYSDSDVQFLKTVGTLRRVRFSMDEIRSMNADPETIDAVCIQCRQRLEDEVTALSEISHALAAMEAGCAKDIFSLADILFDKAQQVELPARDVQVNFARFDGESWDEPEPEPEPGDQLVEGVNDRIKRIMGAQPESYVYSTGFYSNSPSKHMAVDEFSAAKSMGPEAGYPDYMSSSVTYPRWARVIRTVCTAVLAIFCIALLIFAVYLYGGGMLVSPLYNFCRYICLHWYIFALIPAAGYGAVTIISRKKQ